MNRRDFMLTVAAVSTVAPLAAFAKPFDYTPGLVEKSLADGKTVFLDFKAVWCTTCAAQTRVMNALKAENPAYEQNITFIAVDWDDYRKADITKRLNIPRRSTLVVLQGDQELGRIVAGTRRDDIKALMDRALQAASA